MRLLGQFRELEAKRDQLMAEEAKKEDPQVERERLLASVKENNRESANMEREYVEDSYLLFLIRQTSAY